LKIVETHDEMIQEIGHVMSKGDLILLKGSRRMQLEKVVEGLRWKADGT
jgi:UDP-N-acetylmuramyl pentapeptide synthase